MRQVVLAVAVLVSLPAGAASPAGIDAGVLAIDRRVPGRERLVIVDPVTLRAVNARRLHLAGHGWPYAFTADRSRLVLGRWKPPSLHIVDARALRVLGTVPLGDRRRAEIKAVAWLGEQIVVLLERRSRALELLRVDTAQRRVIRSIAIGRWTAQAAATETRFVALLAPLGRIGRARLLVVTTERVHTVRLAGISTGWMPAHRGRPATAIGPGLAVSRREPRAWVIGARRSVEVDLQALALRYRDEPRHLSLQKVPVVGTGRDAQWLSSGELAVSGWDAARDDRGRIAFVPTGLRLLEPASWTDRVVHRRAQLFYVRPDQLLTIALDEPDCGAPALMAYTLAGTPLYSVCEDRATGEIEFAGRYARLGRVDGRVAVVDLDTGLVVARIRDAPRLDPLETTLVQET